MAQKTLAVAVIHGMGSQDAAFAEPMIAEINHRLGALAERVAWQPIYWAPVLEERELRYLREAKREARLDWEALRRFVATALGDAVGYRQVDNPEHRVYESVHAVVARSLADLECQVGSPSVPLVVMAHSLGGHIVSNFVWDEQQRPPDQRTPGLAGCRTLAGLVTFGCNIPLFTFAYDNVVPIDFPGPDLPAPLRSRARWLNFYDPDDVLGWPLRPINDAYRAVVSADIAVPVGSPLTGWNPMAHSSYWTDNDFTRPAADFLRSLLE